MFFFFKQKTAYEMRISDWSSDVCSSDLSVSLCWKPKIKIKEAAMSTYEDRLNALREQLKRDRLDGFVVPLTDEHMSEYVGAYAQRLAWLTGFQGSAGSAVVLPEEAALFVDGRYTLQVREQVDAKNWQ